MEVAYLLNIHTGTIHSAERPCYRAKQMKDAYKRFFSTYEAAEADFSRRKRKALSCASCLKEKP